MGLLEFLRAVGIHARVNTMIARERHVASYTSMNRLLCLLGAPPPLPLSSGFWWRAPKIVQPTRQSMTVLTPVPLLTHCLSSVQARLSSQQGISFTEFTYQLLQAYDFYHLHKSVSCTIQIGGSDQWGNILAGIDLINRVDPTVAEDGTHEEKVFGVTTPLLTTASGAKFGKSAGNAVALESSITSVFDFYQVSAFQCNVRLVQAHILVPKVLLEDV